MSTITLAPASPAVPLSRERRHRILLAVAYAVAIATLLALAYYGRDYYLLSAAERPFSAKHAELKPSGSIGLKLGLLGLGMFLIIFLYPLRKRWAWLSRQGSTKNWMDFHVLLGLAAPFVIALHASFKFSGFAGMAFWIMTAVALSGVVGRYLYSQVPRRVTAAELSLKESRELQEKYTGELSSQHWIQTADLQALFRLPDEAQVTRMPILFALSYMVFLDLIRPWQIARLRRKTLTFAQSVNSFGGLLRTNRVELERAIDVARAQAALSKRLAFLSRAQQVFHLWHVVHKPFSYSFALLAILHIGVVWMLGYI